MFIAIGTAIVAAALFVACLVYGHPNTWGIVPDISFDRTAEHEDECGAEEGQICALVAVDPTPTPLPTPTPIPVPESAEAGSTPEDWNLVVPANKVAITAGTSAKGTIGSTQVDTDQGFVAAVAAGDRVKITVTTAYYILVDANEAEAAFREALQKAMLDGPLSDQVFPLEESWLNPN